MSTTIHIQLLGGFRFLREGEPVEGLAAARLQSLLAYLLIHADAPQPRRQLAFLFWPDSTDKQARTNLRQLLHHLRNALPNADELVHSDRQVVQWRPQSAVELDVTAFEWALRRASTSEERRDRAAARQALEVAVSLYGGDLLPDCYDEWIAPQRTRLRQAFFDALERLVQHLEAERSYPEAIFHCRRLLHEDPVRESGYRALMRLHASNGDRAGALRAYHECSSTLNRELDVMPEPRTRALYDRLTHIEEPPAPESELGAGGSEPATLAGATPLVGRTAEWERLQRAWETAARGHPGFALVLGEAGIGKSRLAEELVRWVARLGFRGARTRCFAAEGRLAYGPVVDWLRSASLREGVARMEAPWVAEVARILPELRMDRSDLPRTAGLAESWQRRRFFEGLARGVLAIDSPLLLLIDDLQWCDPETLEWLRFLMRADIHARLLVLGTARVEEVAPPHPLNALILELRRTGQLTEFELGPLDPQETTELAQRLAHRAVDPQRAARLYQETEGVPLFVVETLRGDAWQGPPSDSRGERAGAAPSASLVPPRVQEVIAARLAALSPPARSLAELAATVGRDFQLDVLSEASTLNEDRVVHALDELWRRRIVREHGDVGYDFSHDKIREVAYVRISAARRRALHRRVAEALAKVRPLDINGTSAQMAAHFERAGMLDQAITYYRRAAGFSERAFAEEAAIRHLEKALELLNRLPEGAERDLRELELQSALASPLTSARGWGAPEVGRTHARVRALADAATDHDRLRGALWGLHAFHLVRAQLGRSQELAEFMLERAEDREDADLEGAARYALALSAFHLGDPTRTRRELGKHSDLGHPAEGRFPPWVVQETFATAYETHALWVLGCPDRALSLSQEARRRSEAGGNPVVQAVVLAYQAMLRQFRNEPDAVLESTETAIEICRTYGITYYERWSTLLRGWARTRTGEPEAGIDEIERGLEGILATGADLRRPYYLALLAQAHADAGQVDVGLGLLADALAVARRNEERWCEPELHRLRGEILRRVDSRQEAEACLCTAVRLARAQPSPMLELRARVSLTRHRSAEGAAAGARVTEARTGLSRVYEAFSEGWETPDLLEAAAILDGSG